MQAHAQYAFDPIEPDITDEQLLAQLCDRDVAALEALYDRYSRQAFGLAYKVLGDRGMAEEVTQDAFMSVWRQAATYRPNAGRVRPWLLAIVHHRAIDRTRRIRERQPLATLDDAWMVHAGADVFRDAYRGVQRDAIRAALAQLPDEQRIAVDLLYFRGHTFSEIAELTGVAAGTAKSRVRLGLAKLKLLLDEELV
jgi:RNA polymerase sigma-70 factor (ECF subfamily)